MSLSVAHWVHETSVPLLLFWQYEKRRSLVLELVEFVLCALRGHIQAWSSLYVKLKHRGLSLTLQHYPVTLFQTSIQLLFVRLQERELDRDNARTDYRGTFAILCESVFVVEKSEPSFFCTLMRAHTRTTSYTVCSDRVFLVKGGSMRGPLSLHH